MYKIEIIYFILKLIDWINIILKFYIKYLNLIIKISIKII